MGNKLALSSMVSLMALVTGCGLDSGLSQHTTADLQAESPAQAAVAADRPVNIKRDHGQVRKLEQLAQGVRYLTAAYDETNLVSRAKGLPARQRDQESRLAQLALGESYLHANRSPNNLQQLTLSKGYLPVEQSTSTLLADRDTGQSHEDGNSKTTEERVTRTDARQQLAMVVPSSAQMLSNEDLEDHRGGFNGLSFGFIISGSFEAMSLDSGGSFDGITEISSGDPDLAFESTDTDFRLGTIVGDNFQGASGIFQIANVPGNNVILNNILNVQLVVINSGDANPSTLRTIMGF